MIYVGPLQARDLLDQLASEIVHPERALGDADGGRDDVTARVPASPEPPD